jgi:hypothetical protein
MRKRGILWIGVALAGLCGGAGLLIHLGTFVLPLPDLPTLQAWTIQSTLFFLGGTVVLGVLSNSPAPALRSSEPDPRLVRVRKGLSSLLTPYWLAGMLCLAASMFWFVQAYREPGPSPNALYQVDMLRM